MQEMCVLRRFRKTVSVGADVTSDGRLFQRRHPATGNARHRQWTTVYVGSPAAWMTTAAVRISDGLDVVGKIT